MNLPAITRRIRRCESEVPAQLVLEYAIAEAITVEREECASMIEMTTSELLLMAGEMTAQELRTVKAVLAQRAVAIRMRSNN